MSDFLQPHGLQHTRLSCPSLSPAVYSNSNPLSLWCHPTISFSVSFFFSPSIFPSIRVFSIEAALRIRWPSIGVLASASVLPMTVRGWYPLGLTGLISLQSKGLSRVFSSTFQKQGIGYIRLQSMRSLRVGYNWATSLSLFIFMHWRRKWQLTPVFLPGESQRQKSLVGCHLWGRSESYTTEAT